MKLAHVLVQPWTHDIVEVGAGSSVLMALWHHADSDVQVVADPYVFLKRQPFASKHLLTQQDSWGASGACSPDSVALLESPKRQRSQEAA